MEIFFFGWKFVSKIFCVVSNINKITVNCATFILRENIPFSFRNFRHSTVSSSLRHQAINFQIDAWCFYLFVYILMENFFSASFKIEGKKNTFDCPYHSFSTYEKKKNSSNHSTQFWQEERNTIWGGREGCKEIASKRYHLSHKSVHEMERRRGSDE